MIIKTIKINFPIFFKAPEYKNSSEVQVQPDKFQN